MVHRQREEDDRELVESIQRLHELCTPVKMISQRVHLRETTVRFVIQRGRLPQQQLPLHWGANR